MKTHQLLFLIVLTLWVTTVVDAQRIKGGAGFVKVGVANTSGAGSVLDQIAPVGVAGYSDQFYLLGGRAITEPATSCLHWMGM
ncbi:MAG: hypothetical protein JWP57_1651 [Spirosoma sp.]|nr:hypothetical protein [Spirosoma sp.]